MSFSTILFTEKGRALQTKAQAGTALNFTKLAMGSGLLGGQSQITLTALIEPKVILPINEIKRKPTYATIKGIFRNQDISTGFYWREIGLFAQDPDIGEILYCYGNAGTLAEYIPPQTSEIIERVVSITALIGDAATVTASIDESLIYVTKPELEAVSQKADQAFQSASNGKTLIKNAITGVDPEVTIPTDATFSQLATAIGQIKTGVDTDDATATAEQILVGMTAYVKEVKVTGTMTNRGAVNITPGTANQAISKGYHNGNGVVAGDPDLVTGNIRAGVNLFGVSGKSSVVDTADATIIDGTQLLNGYTAYKNGSKISGSMTTQSPDYADQIPCLTQTAGAGSGDGLNYAYMQIPNARFYTGAINWVRSYEPHLLTSNILSGKSIFGVSGSVTAGKRSASGTTTSNGGGTYIDGDGSTITAYGIVVSGLTFQPSYIMAFYEYPNNSNPYVIFNANGVGLDTYEIKILVGFSAVRFGSKQINGFKLQGAAYVNSTGFNMPTLIGGIAYHWTAIE